MRCIYIDGEAGAAGDMLLGALLDLGVDAAEVSDAIRPVVPCAFELTVERVSVNGIGANRLHVKTDEGAMHRTLPVIESLLEQGSLSGAVRERAAGVYRRLAVAEAKVHGATPETVRFHEVGAADAVVDIVGVVWALEKLVVERVLCAPLVLGSGVGRSAHGPIHYPAPAVMEILRGKPVRQVSGLGETTTPTGAALLAELAEFTEEVQFTPERTGYGAGSRTLADRPNLLRATLGALPMEGETDRLWLAASDIDNTRPEVFEWMAERLRAAGAIDVVMTDVAMKKNRRGTRVEALCKPERRAAVAEIILMETASLGVRWHQVTRTKLRRTVEAVATPWGTISVKVARMPNGERRAVPEYDECRRAAESSGRPLLSVIEEVQRLYGKVTESPGEGTGKG